MSEKIFKGKEIVKKSFFIAKKKIVTKKIAKKKVVTKSFL